MNLQERRDRKARQQKAEAETLAENDAANCGRDHFKKSPNDMLIEVCRWAALHYTNNNQIIAFLRGYCEARRDHDAFKRGE